MYRQSLSRLFQFDRPIEGKEYEMAEKIEQKIHVKAKNEKEIYFICKSIDIFALLLSLCSFLMYVVTN